MDMACVVGTEVLYNHVTLWNNTSSAYDVHITDGITGNYEHWQGLRLANNRPVFSKENTAYDNKTAKSSHIKSDS